MKKKVLLSSVLTIALCLCLIAGFTFALFTSQSEVNIAVTAGKVDMTAGISITKLESVKGDSNGTIVDENGATYSYADVTSKNQFTNGGTATVSGSVLTLNKVTPGDRVTFQISGTNTSNVAIQYRYIIECMDGYALMSGLVVSVNDVTYTKPVASYTSAWDDLGANTPMPSVTVSLELPVSADNAYQEETAAIRVLVEAVQYNAVTENEENANAQGIAVEYIKRYTAANANELKAALTGTAPEEKYIVVSLSKDVTYAVGENDSPAVMGFANTEVIAIDGNGHTLTFMGMSPENNDIVTNNGKLVISEANIIASGALRENNWNSHNIIFACDVELINVTSNTALALKANATLKNVTIKDNAQSDTYAIWIQPNGQTVTLDVCNIDMNGATDGRGIKIDEQYIKNPAQKVTLNVSNTTFKTEEKGAIVVNSAVGADISLYQVNISEVKADAVNAVWVTKGTVTVIGGTKVSG